VSSIDNAVYRCGHRVGLVTDSFKEVSYPSSIYRFGLVRIALV